MTKNLSKYEHKGVEYLRVTSIINRMFPFNKKSFDAWCKKTGVDPEWVMRISSIMGSKVSMWLNDAFRGLEEYTAPAVGAIEKNLYWATRKYLDDYEIIDSEVTVYNKEWGYAGTLDAISQDKKNANLLYLDDFKTFGAWRGFYKRDPKKLKKASVQLDMYNETFKKKLTARVIIFKPDGTYEVEVQEPNDSWKEWIVKNTHKEIHGDKTFVEFND